MTRVETCNAKGIMGDDFRREGDDRAWKDLEEKYEKWLEEEDKDSKGPQLYEARQARVAIAMSQYGMDPQDADSGPLLCRRGQCRRRSRGPRHPGADGAAAGKSDGRGRIGRRPSAGLLCATRVAVWVRFE